MWVISLLERSDRLVLPACVIFLTLFPPSRDGFQCVLQGDTCLTDQRTVTEEMSRRIFERGTSERLHFYT